MLSRVVSQLCDAGLLQRSSDSGDRRAAWVDATPKGRRLAERIRRERTDALNLALATLSDRDRRHIERRSAGAHPAGRGAPGAPRVTRVVRAGRVTFAALAVPNYRRYYRGQSISLIGTWMQMTAQAWLVLSLTHSSTALGVMVALQTLPVLLLAPYGGVIADRVDKRRTMIALQSAMGIQALILGVLTLTDAIRLWQIGVLALLLGLNNAFENPARQSFMLEMVGATACATRSASTRCWSTSPASSGPAVAGLLIATSAWGVLPRQRGQLRRRGRTLSRWTAPAITPSPPPRAQGPAPRGPALRPRTPELGRPAADDGGGGVLHLRVPGLASGDRQPRPALGAGGFGLMTAAMGVGAVARRAAGRGPGQDRSATADDRGASAFGVAMPLAAAGARPGARAGRARVRRRRRASRSWRPATRRSSWPPRPRCAGA